jgi:hypothetical protein
VPADLRNSFFTQMCHGLRAVVPWSWQRLKASIQPAPDHLIIAMIRLENAPTTKVVKASGHHLALRYLPFPAITFFPLGELKFSPFDIAATIHLGVVTLATLRATRRTGGELNCCCPGEALLLNQRLLGSHKLLGGRRGRDPPSMPVWNRLKPAVIFDSSSHFIMRHRISPA